MPATASFSHRLNARSTATTCAKNGAVHPRLFHTAPKMAQLLLHPRFATPRHTIKNALPPLNCANNGAVTKPKLFPAPASFSIHLSTPTRSTPATRTIFVIRTNTYPPRLTTDN